MHGHHLTIREREILERFTFDRSNFPRGGSPGPPRFQVL